ncbi:MAG: Hpt domain-containing protein [Zoogloeaceae bacterium]|nr:Hpt domain-containing protein [Zoogloeaceae bacterium]
MSDVRELDLGPLTWVKSEIELALAKARDALDKAVQSESAKGIKFAQTHLHQACGALSIVGLDGLTQFATTLEQMFALLARGERPLDDNTVELGRRGLAAIGNYLEELIHDTPDQPLRLFALHTEVAAVCGLRGVTAADLFFPDTSRRPPRNKARVARMEQAERVEQVRAQRALYQRGLLRILRNQSDAAGARELLEAARNLEPLHDKPASNALWWAAQAFFESLVNGDLPDDPMVKRLCSALDKELGRDALASGNVPERLMRDLLYFVALGKPRSPLQQAVRDTWQLDALLPEAGARVSEIPLGPLLKSLRAELEAGKQAWDAFSGGKAAALPTFEAHLNQLRAAAAGLGRPMLDRLLEGLAGFTQWLRKDPLAFNDVIALEVAAAQLLIAAALGEGTPDPGFSAQVGDTLTRLSALTRGAPLPSAEKSATVETARRAEEKDALTQVAREILSNLAQIEQRLDDFFRNQAKRAPLAALAGPLKQIEGALALIGDDQATSLIREVTQRIDELAHSAEEQDASEFESLAHQLSALGFYVEALEHGHAELQQFLAPAHKLRTNDDEPIPPTVALARPAGEAGLVAATGAAIAKLTPEPELQAPPLTPTTDTDTAFTAPAPEPGSDALAPEALDYAERAEEQASPDETEQDDSGLDAELLGIFIEEAHEVLATIVAELEYSIASPAETGHLTAVRRGFHTLKGSGRMVGLHALPELAWAIEQTLNHWLQLELQPTEKLYALIRDAHSFFDEWVGAIERGNMQDRDAEALVATAEALREPAETGTRPAPAPAASAADFMELQLETDLSDIASLDESLESLESLESSEFEFSETQLDRLEILDERAFVPLPSLDEVAQPANAPTAAHDETAFTLAEPSALASRTFEEASEAPDLSEESIAEAAEPPEADLVFDLESVELAETYIELDTEDTLDLAEETPVAADGDEAASLPKPSMKDAGAEQISLESAFDFGDLASPAAEMALELEPSAVEEAEPEPLEALPVPVASADVGMEPELAEAADDAAQSDEADFAHIGDIEISKPLLELYLTEATEHIERLRDEFDHLRYHPGSALSELSLRAVHTLAGISGTARVLPIHHLGKAFEHALERLQKRATAPQTRELDLFDTVIDRIETMLDEVESAEMPLATPELERQLDELGTATDEPEAPPAIAIAAMHETAAPVEAIPAEPEVAEPPAPEPSPQVHDDLDEQLLPIFVEEANDLLSQLHDRLRHWQDELDNPDHNKATARLLHTLKGSARMTGAMTLGELVHQLESRLELGPRSAQPTAALVDDLVGGLDQVQQIVDRIAAGESPVLAPPTVDDDAAKAAGPAVTIDAETGAVAEIGGAMLRVKAETVDRLVNEAGEIGIARTRIEGELRTLRRSMLDLTENVIRLRNQLREVEIQADVQMQSRQARADQEHTEFDPLEMDRYTRLQELTRLMAESVGDVTTVQQNLLRNLDGAELALHGQARMSRDLQQALMQVRMVPFDSLADRLYRVVRQSAKDLGKRVNLDIRGGRIEIDRSVLERMTSALEHLLRNAVAHGVESPDVRRAAGKDEIGQITLAVSHEANEILITLADDGKGLNYDAIASRARERGLLGADETADTRRLTNLIFVPGFSTADSLSAVSGRGVGMDVVKSETAAVGGRIDVSSSPETGTSFKVYLPLTLAVTQAVLVRASSHSYAIPSNMVAQVLELKADAMQALIQDGGIDWVGERFAYRYLPHLLGEPGARPELSRFNWILLLRAGAQTLALHVDQLRGNQEIVVKNAGPQLVRIIGISGATVLGDGEIVLILNPVALASRSLGDNLSAGTGDDSAHRPARPIEHIPTVMIVDDSLTVRKITGRLMEREGYRVITAKDGTDALEKLLETIPDVILSDIEMPRMDGFDLVRNIRADERTQAIPIIMVTSRLADKHRQYAMKVGANHYLGKPFEEDELLGLIRGYMAALASA